MLGEYQIEGTLNRLKSRSIGAQKFPVHEIFWSSPFGNVHAEFVL